MFRAIDLWLRNKANMMQIHGGLIPIVQCKKGPIKKEKISIYDHDVNK